MPFIDTNSLNMIERLPGWRPVFRRLPDILMLRAAFLPSRLFLSYLWFPSN